MTGSSVTPRIEITGEIRRGHFPNWLRRKILKRYGVVRGNGSSAASALSRMEEVVYPLAIDHWGSVELSDGRLAFVVEPYVNPVKLTQSLVEFASEIECEWVVSSCSEWFPPHTILGLLIEPRVSPP